MRPGPQRSGGRTRRCQPCLSVGWRYPWRDLHSAVPAIAVSRTPTTDPKAMIVSRPGLRDEESTAGGMVARVGAAEGLGELEMVTSGVAVVDGEGTRVTPALAVAPAASVACEGAVALAAGGGL